MTSYTWDGRRDTARPHTQASMADAEKQQQEDPLLQDDIEARVAERAARYFTWQKLCLFLTLILVFVMLPIVVIMVFLYAPSAYMIRCHLHLPHCEKPEILGK